MVQMRSHVVKDIGHYLDRQWMDVYLVSVEMDNIVHLHHLRRTNVVIVHHLQRPLASIVPTVLDYYVRWVDTLIYRTQPLEALQALQARQPT
jgi:hypothetical protein